METEEALEIVYNMANKLYNRYSHETDDPDKSKQALDMVHDFVVNDCCCRPCSKVIK